jgi:hypothetical protein
MEHIHSRVINVQVSDLRERQYETVGIGSSYLFRVDDELVVPTFFQLIVHWFHIALFLYIVAGAF